ncbi:NUC188 domain-containing protein [Zychaea mexicana]|uniref:NUC188 domain-containing protein n=1 Tax=Zychaea mexicana TaxID=64656 RepID=UPI0022FE8604|nr:NUC188 domain-containing protein [Zychaea mexicana]KAI9495878.1 NUC188 domain-containing protein [Zychaea mexicana]
MSTPEKRSAPDQSNLTGRQKRRAKNSNARKIGTPKEFINTLAKDAPRVAGAIRADEFTAARLQEINAMQTAIRNAGNALNTLTFQALPRDMRRRAASHKLTRLPAHLRARAAREMENSPPTKRKTRRGKRQNKDDVVSREYLRRQKENKWMETHIYHTKRMHMNNIWGYRLAARPNVKSARSLYRAFQHTSIIHDASYVGCLELVGKQEDIVYIVNTVTDVTLPSVGSERFIKGNRIGHTHIYEYMNCPSNPICPVSFLWKPTMQCKSEGENVHTLWLWIHPSAFECVLKQLKHAREQTKLDAVRVNDLRDEFIRFDLSGARTTALLQAIVKPVEESNQVDKDASSTYKSSKVWRDLYHLRSASSIPPGSVIGLTVQDPRLAFAQKVHERTNQVPPEADSRLTELFAQWPEDIAYSDIWDENIRKKLLESLPSEHALAKRREENLLPGTKLEFKPNDGDVQIPVLLVQRSQGQGHSRNKRRGEQDTCKTELLEGWTLFLPKGCAMPFWKSFMFAGARVAGYEDLHALYFESGVPCYPYDYLGSRACEDARNMAKHEAESAWLRRPPAKRLNYAKLGVERPFDAAFDTLTLVSATTKTVAMLTDDTSGGDETKPGPDFYLLHGHKAVSVVLSAKTDDEAQSALLAYLAELYTKRGLKPIATLPFDAALIQVRLEFFDRGRPEANAMIYLITDDAEYETQTSYIRNREPGLKNKKKLLESLEDDEEAAAMAVDEKEKLKFPPPDDLIGYLTTANFSFHAGCGSGLGACTARGMRRLQELDNSRQREIKTVVLVRNTKALQCRPAKLQFLP